ncbi:MAG: hypothetical protein HXS45_10335 [Theionarchaea archaeon]|nr:hypothetical protein [Theionarchaea archaeon]
MNVHTPSHDDSMTARLIFEISQPLNFLGYARSRLSPEKSYLWSREVESLFALDEPLDTVLTRIPVPIGEEVGPFKRSFEADWPVFRLELFRFKENLESLWKSNQQRILSMMKELWLFHEGSLEVFPVMPFFRSWPRSTPLSMPILDQHDQKTLELLIHEVLHRTTESDHPQSIWRYLRMVFTIKRIPTQSRFLMQHAFIYTAASWIGALALEKEFQRPHLTQETSDQEQFIEMDEYMHFLFPFFSSELKADNPMILAEDIVECCQQDKKCQDDH